jgi:hypothetical protein
MDIPIGCQGLRLAQTQKLIPGAELWCHRGCLDELQQQLYENKKSLAEHPTLTSFPCRKSQEESEGEKLPEYCEVC